MHFHSSQKTTTNHTHSIHSLTHSALIIHLSAGGGTWSCLPENSSYLSSRLSWLQVSQSEVIRKTLWPKSHTLCHAHTRNTPVQVRSFFPRQPPVHNTHSLAVSHTLSSHSSLVASCVRSVLDNCVPRPSIEALVREGYCIETHIHQLSFTKPHTLSLILSLSLLLTYMLFQYLSISLPHSVSLTPSHAYT